jgi:hypothetical protein
VGQLIKQWPPFAFLFSPSQRKERCILSIYFLAQTASGKIAQIALKLPKYIRLMNIHVAVLWSIQGKLHGVRQQLTNTYQLDAVLFFETRTSSMQIK